MIRTASSFVITFALIGNITAFAQTPPTQPAARRVQTAPKAAPPSAERVLQPRLIALDVEKCVGCATSVRKRVGVMPVKVGIVSSELGMPGDLVGSKVRDALETVVAQSGKVLVVNRSELGDVVAEQRLAASAGVTQDLAPTTRAIIPAQLLLYATVDRADLAVQTTKHSNNTAADYYRQALAKEQQAVDFQRRARDAQFKFDREAIAERRPGAAEAFGQIVDSMTNCNNRPTPGLVESCERQKQLNEQNRLNAANRARESRQRHHQEELARLQGQAESLQSDADMLRRKAEIESRREVTQTKTTTLNVALTWRAIDASTGAVVASGQSSGLRSHREEGASTQSAFHSTEQTSSARHDALVNAALDEAMSAMAREFDEKLNPVPFRAKVAKTDLDSVFINAGSNLGVAVGDTFGVREKAEALTDPDTGELLSAPGAPVGYVRVVEVFEKTSRAQVVKQAVAVKRGDELEWIGVFVPAGSQAQK